MLKVTGNENICKRINEKAANDCSPAAV